MCICIDCYSKYCDKYLEDKKIEVNNFCVFFISQNNLFV